MKLIIDLLGTDLGPKEVVLGVINSLKNTNLNYILVGPEQIARETIKEKNADIHRFEFIDTNVFIKNEEDPARTLRKKKDASLVLGLNRLNEEGDGFLSGGSTGALLAGGLFITKRIGNIKRATLMAPVPNVKGGVTLLADTGAVVDTTAEMLSQFASLASIVARDYLGKSNPKVYLLNVGTEEGKGDLRSKEAYNLIKENDKLNFMGNIEAREFLSGEADVIVADGFSGNVMLKSTEGALGFVFSELKSSLMSSLKTKIGGFFIKSSLSEFKDKYDYKKVGAGMLVGVNKPLFKAHGNSDRIAIEHAIYQAEKFLEGNIIESIKKEFNDEV
ncbi:MAG: phosphate acyltransferase PlsX [Helcococcus sp.]|nr:phosphate acyltransferase PlsX [Helcococcus sp.]